MVLRVIEEASQFSDDLTSGVVVVESDLEGEVIEELNSVAARNKALGYANAKGVADARINGSPTGAYPIIADGKSLDQVQGANGESLPYQHPDMQTVAYRIDIPVVRKLV